MKKLVFAAVSTFAIASASVGHAEDAQAHGYLIGNYKITDQAVYQQYLDAASPLAAKYHGTIIVFNLTSTALEGQPGPVIAIAEFPTYADVETFYNSPEYTEARKLRIASTEGTILMTEGFVPPQQ